MRHPWQGLGSLPRGVWILFATTLINRLGTMTLPFLVLYLTRSRHSTAAQAGFVITVYGLAAIVTGPVAGRLCDRIGTVRVLQGSLLLSGCVVLLYPLAHRPAAILAMTVAWACTNEAFRPANLSMFSDLAGPAQRRTAFAVARLAVNLGMSDDAPDPPRAGARQGRAAAPGPAPDRRGALSCTGPVPEDFRPTNGHSTLPGASPRIFNAQILHALCRSRQLVRISL